MMDEANTLFITDDEGNEKAYTILFTFSVDETGKQYVVVQDPEDEEEVYGFSYTEDGELAPLEEDEYPLVAEVLEAWDGEMK
jgi:uncharacterized protein YrzB (UPF0473 family)